MNFLWNECTLTVNQLWLTSSCTANVLPRLILSLIANSCWKTPLHLYKYKMDSVSLYLVFPAPLCTRRKIPRMKLAIKHSVRPLIRDFITRNKMWIYVCCSSALKTLRHKILQELFKKGIVKGIILITRFYRTGKCLWTKWCTVVLELCKFLFWKLFEISNKCLFSFVVIFVDFFVLLFPVGEL